ncbi:MAG: ATP phosphoribosyltransferase regulatory subunit, partial [Clostridia bacterium]|nr:ATP phosphoribosyltransferase regulatory subunit [Clostridia bacterium]
MNYEELNLRNNEKILFSLRALFEKYGYTQYKVSKFEEYDFYMKNKSFLVSENVLTFTDTTGKLMALKPDVTLSIVKNTDVGKDELSKVYYSENVYRTTPGSQGFKEIMQTGLECIGKIDVAAICEVLELAVKSLETVSDDYTLDISHAGFLAQLLKGFAAPKELLELISSKNTEAVKKYAADRGTDEKTVRALETLTGLYLPLSEGLDRLFPVAYVEELEFPLNELKEIFEVLNEKGIADKIRLDMTMSYDPRYYNGIIFRGFVNGVPDEVLAGGRYDNLMEKLGKKAGAIGFAVYTDRLE